MKRVIGMDIHRTFAEVVIWEAGQLRPAGRVDMSRAGLEGFGRTLSKEEDEVVIEATGNAMAVVRALEPHVARVIVANPMQVKAIAYAQVKTDKIDAGVLASLRAANFLPEVWLPDTGTERMRRQVARRNQVVRHRTRIKNEVHAILHAHLVPCCPHDLFARVGRDWLGRQTLPDDERAAVARHLRELDRLGEDLDVLDRDIAQAAINDPVVKRLLTITGVNLIVAAGLVAAIGDVRRFASSEKLVSYVGLNPRVRQSGLGLAQHGRISKQGRSHARAMLVEAAWAAAKAPGPLRSFFLRIRARRGHQVAAVAVARKLAVLCWHLLTKEVDYQWARPALVANKIRAMELQAGQPARKGNKRGSTYVYNVKELRDREIDVARHAEQVYEQFVRGWQRRAPTKRRTGAAHEGATMKAARPS